MKDAKDTLCDIPKYGDHMTVEEFIQDAATGCLIDYDGYGKYATATKMIDMPVMPSDVVEDVLNCGDYTHVVWFNK